MQKGKSIVIRGEVRADEDLTLAGRVEGSIEVPNHVLTIEDGAQMVATITARRVMVSGSITGNITAADQVVLTEGAIVEGDLVAPRITMADGARFNGRIDMPARVVAINADNAA
jgi:cytoskeletal protein CcmA (bactofilin family)